MAEDVQLPGLGNVDKKYLFAGLALILGIVGYAYFRRASGGGGTVQPTSSGDPNAFQGAALPQGSYDAYGNLVGASGNASLGTAANQPANWTQKATDWLTNAFGYDGKTVLDAITHYSNKQLLTPAEADLIGAARNLVGMDPWNLPINLKPPDPTPTPAPVIPAPTTGGGGGTTLPGVEYWDAWQNQQMASGLYRSDPNGGLDWGVIARNTFGASANPTKQAVFERSLKLHSANPDAAKKYMFYVPQSVIPTLKY